MKKILLSLALMFAINCYAQKSTEFAANNGVTYKVGDTVKLGLGTGINGQFVFLQMGGWAMANGSASPIGRGYANAGVVIKKMRTYKIKGVEKMYFTVGGGNITNYLLAINDAIEVCEVKPCKVSGTSVQATSIADELLKLKSLMDAGAITKEEYDAQKKKLLGT